MLVSHNFAPERANQTYFKISVILIPEPINSIYLQKQKSMRYEIMRVRESGQWGNGESHSRESRPNIIHRPVALCISVYVSRPHYCSSIHSTATPTATTPLTQAGEAINHDQIYKGREDHANHTYIYSCDNSPCLVASCLKEL